MTGLDFTGASISNFVDVDFGSAATESGNMCGMIPDLYVGDSSFKIFEKEYPPIPRDQWKDIIQTIKGNGGGLERRIRKIHNQSSEPSCVYNAAAQGFEVTWNKQFGDANWIEMSPISGYRYNGSRWSGSSVPGALEWMLEHGLLPTNSDANKALVEKGYFKHTHPNTGYGVVPPSGFEETAKIFTIREFLKITTVEGWFTALMRLFACIGGRDGHCIMHCCPELDGSTLLSMYANSWGAWGATRAISPLSGESKGFGFDTESKVRTMVARGAWAIRSVNVPVWIAA